MMLALLCRFNYIAQKNHIKNKTHSQSFHNRLFTDIHSETLWNCRLLLTSKYCTVYYMLSAGVVVYTQWLYTQSNISHVNK